MTVTGCLFHRQDKINLAYNIQMNHFHRKEEPKARQMPMCSVSSHPSLPSLCCALTASSKHRILPCMFTCLEN